ncbi:MAG TPA: type II secretion system F family protein [Chloroflexia bacterium]|nr:type II secretion system F family protein [Chloroflexia bacterium]
MSPTIVAFLGAGAVFLMFLAFSRVMAGNRELESRVQEFAGRTPTPSRPASREKLTVRTDKLISNARFAQRAQRNLAQADLKLTVTEFVLIKALTLVLGWLAGNFIGRDQGILTFLFAVIFAVIGWFVPDWYVKFSQGRRIRTFNNQLGDTVILMANSLRSGYSFLQTMDLVGKEAGGPMAVEFKRAVREVGLGIGVQEALINLTKRVPSDDLDLMITAVNISFEVGGNLAVILDTIAHTIRERVRIQGEIRALTAMGVASGWIISLLPVALGIVIMLINPTYMGAMFVWPWICMPICAGMMIAVGAWAIMKIVTIEV